MAPNSPDLDPDDCAAYEGVCSRACIALRLPAWMISDCMLTCWKNLDVKTIDESTDHWRDKLKAANQLNGGHNEQLF